MHRLSIITAVTLALTAGVISPAQAAAPSNDGPGKARAATGIGYSDSVNVSQATSGRGDPTTCSNNASVWYKFTSSSTGTINVNTSGSNYDTVIGVYTGGPRSFTQVKCRNWGQTRQAALDLEVQAGRTYYFMVGACCGNGRDGRDFARQPLLLQFNLMAPLRIEMAVLADTGTVSGTAEGDARLTLSTRCNHVAKGGWIEGTLQQRVGEIFIARGFTFRRPSCQTSSTEVTLRFIPEGDVAFGEGPATVWLRLVACSQETGTCTRRRLTREVVLALP